MRIEATYPLSAQSKDYIKLAAVIGATIGGGAGLMAWGSEADQPHATFWQKLATFSKYVLAPATIGAGIGAGIAYLTTHEANFESMQKALAQTEITSDFEIAMKDGAVLDDFQKAHINNKYPLHKSYENLNNALKSIQSLKQKLPNIINSGIDTIAGNAQDMLASIKAYEPALLDWMHKIKINAAYTAESQIKTIEMVGREVANAINYNAWVRRYNATRPVHYHLQPRTIVVRR